MVGFRRKIQTEFWLNCYCGIVSTMVQPFMQPLFSHLLERTRLYTGTKSKQMIMQHDILQMGIKTLYIRLHTLDWKLLFDVAYSLYLALSDYQLFRLLQYRLTNEHHKTVDEIWKSIDDFIEPRPANFFREAICKK